MSPAGGEDRLNSIAGGRDSSAPDSSSSNKPVKCECKGTNLTNVEM